MLAFTLSEKNVMTLTLTPETEARLMAVAAQRGLPPVAALDAILTEAETDFNEAVAGIQRGIADAAAGREISLEEYRTRITAEDAGRAAHRVGAEKVA